MGRAAHSGVEAGFFAGPTHRLACLRCAPEEDPPLAHAASSPRKDAGGRLAWGGGGGGADSALVSQGPAAQGSICKACPAAANQGVMSQAMHANPHCLD
jgi:hypothetical protein